MNNVELSMVLERAQAGMPPTRDQALALAACTDTPRLVRSAAAIRDGHWRNLITYSRKVFIPLTQLCRNVCHYCTFAKTPSRLPSPYLSVDAVLEIVRAGARQGCKEALLTLGEKPELRYKAAREALAEMGYATTVEYVAAIAARILDETGLLPHVNAGNLSAAEFELLRPVSASMGMMLETVSERLCQPGMPHYGSPDKAPATRLETIERAGVAGVAFTSGILIGIGETRRERIEALLALRDSHARHGHLQEVIVQNFRAKPDTPMAQAAEPSLEELVWTIAVARLILPAEVSLQVPPNLSEGQLEPLLAAGINDWGGVSPLTPDFVNPEAPWPHLEQLGALTRAGGKELHERLTLYPSYIVESERWLDPQLRPKVLAMVDAEGLPRLDDWVTGIEVNPPPAVLAQLSSPAERVSAELRQIVQRAEQGADLAEAEIVRLFQARGDEFTYVCQAADRLRQQISGDQVSYVVNRNINYTNVCYFKCQFCAFSKGKASEDLRGKPYDLAHVEIVRRAEEAWARGATEVCLQGGIHPDYTGQTYLDILQAIKAAQPQLHVHAFSPLEIWQGAKTLGLPLAEFFKRLKAAGLGSLPGTAAEILDDEVRAVICPDKLSTEQWLEVMEAAHAAGFRSTATIMFGHVERIEHWARHLLRIRALQQRSGGFTEFVPLPFVAAEAPMFRRGQARQGPTFRETILMHAVARLVLQRHIPNIQTSWVKLGERGATVALNCGANDLGGTLMNESITRAAGAQHGQELGPERMEALISGIERVPRLRTTIYGTPPAERRAAAQQAAPLAEIENTPLLHRPRAPRPEASSA